MPYVSGACGSGARVRKIAVQLLGAIAKMKMVLGYMYVRLFGIRPVVFDVDIIAGRRYSYISMVGGVHYPNIGEIFAGGS